VEYDEREDRFVVNKDTFTAISNSPTIYTLEKIQERALIGTAAEREKHFAVRDMEQARAARELMRRAGHPSAGGIS